MRCLVCENGDTKVIDSRLSETGNSIRRRRQCERCNFRFTTFERPQTSELVVSKRDDTTEPYDRNKVERGIMIACEKRPVSLEQLREKLSELEAKWGKDKFIESQTIGEDLLQMLAEVDEIAFVRFASVYQRFSSASEFTALLQRLANQNSDSKNSSED